MKIKILFGLAILLSTFCKGQNQEPIWEFAPNLSDIGLSNFIELDIDNDEKTEIIFSTADNNVSFFKILEYVDSSYTETYVSPFFEAPIYHMTTYDLNQDGLQELYFSTSGTEIKVFDPYTLTFLNPIPTQNMPQLFHLIDFNHDDQLEVIYYNFNNLYIETLNNEILFEDYFSGLNEMLPGNVDLDASLELVINADQALIMNLDDFSIEYMSNDEFGDQILLKDIENNGYDHIYSYEYGGLFRAFDAQIEEVVWSLDLNLNSIDDFEIDDLDSDGQMELIIGTQYSGILCYDMTNSTHLWTIEDLTLGVTDIGIGDFNGDEIIDLIVGTGQNTTQHDMLAIIDVIQQEYSFIEDVILPEYSYSLNDFNGDGIQDFFISYVQFTGGSNEDNFSYILDGSDKSIIAGPYIQNFDRNKSMIPYYINDQLFFIYGYYKNLTIYNATTDEIVINHSFGSNSVAYTKIESFEGVLESAKIVVGLSSGELTFFDFDGQNFTHFWNSPATTKVVWDYKIMDTDFDNQKELAIYSNKIISIYSLPSFTLEKEFFIDLFGGITSFDIIDMDQDGTNEIIYAGGTDTFGATKYLNMMNYESEVVTEFEIDTPELIQVRAVNVDSDDEPEIITLTEAGISVLDNNLEVIMHSEDLHYFPNLRYNHLTITDYDQDNHSEIIVSTYYGIFELKVNSSNIVKTSIIPSNDSVNAWFDKATHSIHLTSEESLENVRVKLCSSNGQEMISNFFNKLNDETIFIHNLPTGIYFLNIQSMMAQKTIKVLIH